jgi:hypothetical protein
MAFNTAIQHDLSLHLQTHRLRDQLAAAEKKLQDYEDLSMPRVSDSIRFVMWLTCAFISLNFIP